MITRADKKITSEPRETEEGLIEQKYSVKLRADQVGTYTIPPIRVFFKIKKQKTTIATAAKANCLKNTLLVRNLMILML